MRWIKAVVSLLLLAVAVWLATRGLDLSKLNASVQRFDAQSIGMVTAALLLGAFLAALRLRLIAADFGYAVSIREAV
jgi:uncharacterized membrane protein YbhN (UPF0104 family)